MKIKQVLILIVVLMSMSLSGCMEKTVTGSETMDVIAYYPLEKQIMCVDGEGDYYIFYVDIYTEKELSELDDDFKPDYPDRTFESDRNEAVITYCDRGGGLFLGTYHYQQVIAYINSSVIDSKQV